VADDGEAYLGTSGLSLNEVYARSSLDARA
jgi:hypothetical protein